MRHSARPSLPELHQLEDGCIGYGRVLNNAVNNFSHAFYRLCGHRRETPMETEHRERIACVLRVDLVNEVT